MKLLLRYMRPYRALLVLVVALVMAQAIGNLYLPELNADIINNGVAKGDTDYIIRTGAYMLAVALGVGVAAIAGVYLSSRVAMGMGRDIRGDIFRAVESFSLVEVNKFGAPSLITRNTNDVQQIQMLVALLLTLMILAPVTAIGGIIMALRQDVPLTGLLVVILPVMSVIIGIMMVKAIPLFQAMQKKIDRINLVMRETLAGIRVIRAFVRVDYEQERFREANADLTDTSLKVTRIIAILMPAMFGVLNLSTVAVLWFGALRVDSGSMPIGNLTAFLQYIMQILFSVLMAVAMFVMVPRAAASIERVDEVLGVEPSIHDPEQPVELGEVHGHVEFRNVEFRYPGAADPVLKNISFHAAPGETTAIIGSTGSGKSTLINLIPRFYDVSGGQVLVDGVDVRELRRADLWDRIGLIPQKSFLFSGTVATNLRYGDEEASDEQLWRALEIAQGKDFVSEMEGGLAAPIAQGGANVSGGQRQRLAIARALVKDPEIVIFDDSFSALDFKTDSLLRAALQRELTNATVLIVAQRVGTIMNADRIIVLEEGEIVGMGTHHELLESNATYREIVFSQLSESEVA